MNLHILESTFAVCQIKQDAGWYQKVGEFFSITYTDDEISIVCDETWVPDDVTCEKGWRAIKVDSMLDFSLVGILAKISDILAKEAISIFVISTFNTDYILVQQNQLAASESALVAAGYQFN